MIVDLIASPLSISHLSIKWWRRDFPSSKNIFGAVHPEMYPVRYILIETLESESFFSCFFLPWLPNTLAFPLPHALKHVSYPPSTKFWITSPNVLPVKFHAVVALEPSELLGHCNNRSVCCGDLCHHRFWLQCLLVVGEDCSFETIVYLLARDFCRDILDHAEVLFYVQYFIFTILPDNLIHHKVFILFCNKKKAANNIPNFPEGIFLALHILLEVVVRGTHLKRNGF